MSCPLCNAHERLRADLLAAVKALRDDRDRLADQVADLEYRDAEHEFDEAAWTRCAGRLAGRVLELEGTAS